jgi:hypothetical protein
MGNISISVCYGSSTRTHFGVEFFQLIFYRCLLCSKLKFVKNNTKLTVTVNSYAFARHILIFI